MTWMLWLEFFTNSVEALDAFHFLQGEGSDLHPGHPAMGLVFDALKQCIWTLHMPDVDEVAREVYPAVKLEGVQLPSSWANGSTRLCHDIIRQNEVLGRREDAHHSVG